MRKLLFLSTILAICLCSTTVVRYVWATGTTYYVDTASSGGDGTTTATSGAHAAFATIAAAQAAVTGNQSDNSLLFNRGQRWREQFTNAASGTSGHQFTVGAYGAGANPIITGADLITPGTSWSLMAGNAVVASQTGKTGSTNLNVRNSASNSEQANKWTATESFSVTQVVVWGRKNGTPTGNIFLKIYSDNSGTPNTSIGQSDNVDVSTLTVDAGGAAVTFTFSTPVALTASTAYYFSVAGDFTVSSSNYAKMHGAVPDATWVERWAFTPWTKKTDFTLYMLIYKANDVIWQSTVTTQPYTITANGIFGKLKASTDDMAAEYDWYWAANKLYVYAASDPDTRYTNPGVEAGARSYGIDTNGQSYVTFQNIDFPTANTYGMYISGNCSNITVQDFTADNSGQFGVLAVPASSTQSNITIERGTTRYNGSMGIKVGSGTGTDITIRTNTVSRNGSYLGASGELLWGGGIGAFGANKTRLVIGPGNVVSYAGYDRLGNRIQPANVNKGVGIWVDTVSGTGNRVIGNKVFNCAGYGFFVEKADGVQIDYNIASGNTYDGFRIDADQDANSGANPAQNNKFYNNTSCGNLHGLTCAGGWAQTGVTVTNNTWKNNVSYGNLLTQFQAKWGGDNDTSNGSGNVYLNNLFGPEATNFIRWGGQDGTPTYKSTYAALDTAYGSSTNSVAGDPKFVSTSAPDFHLQSSSPCINAGVDVGLVTDYEGKSIKGLPDIGAYEFAGGFRRMLMGVGR